MLCLRPTFRRPEASHLVFRLKENLRNRLSLSITLKSKLNKSLHRFWYACRTLEETSPCAMAWLATSAASLAAVNPKITPPPVVGLTCEAQSPTARKPSA